MLTFEWPLLLWALAALPALLALYLIAQRRRRAYAVRFTNLALLGSVVQRGPGARRHVPPLLYLIGLAALLISLARPSAVIAVPRDQATLMLVMDVSGSMGADDLQPNRMRAAQEAARAFVEALPDGAQIGLVSFSEAASVRAAPSRDREAILRAIDGLAPGGGTAIGEGLHLALDELDRLPADESGQVPSTVVLLSDGESSPGRPATSAAARAGADGVQVHTVGVGQRGVTTLLGGTQPVRLDEATLQAIAESTGGQYFYAQEAGALERIYADLGSLVTLVEESTEITALVSALGALLFIAGGLLGLRWFQRFP
jgi:Ca-activated chloride channel family protein